MTKGYTYPVRPARPLPPGLGDTLKKEDLLRLDGQKGVLVTQGVKPQDVSMGGRGGGSPTRPGRQTGPRSRSTGFNRRMSPVPTPPTRLGRPLTGRSPVVTTLARGDGGRGECAHPYPGLTDSVFPPFLHLSHPPGTHDLVQV